MAVKWMNGLVVLVFVLTVLANKEYFQVKAEESVVAAADLNVRSEKPKIVRYVGVDSLAVGKEESVDSPPAVQFQKEVIYVFRIERGMTSKDVSELLYDMGMTDNADEFGDYLIEQGYAGKIQIGSYRVTSDMSFGDVAYKITN